MRRSPPIREPSRLPQGQDGGVQGCGGQVMKASGRQGNPAMVSKLVEEKLTKS